MLIAPGHSKNDSTMKHYFLLSMAFLLAALTTPLMAQDPVFIQEYLERLENSRKYLVLVAETMPEEQYTFKATPESLSFAEHLMHIAWAMDWHAQSLMGGRDARDWNTDTELQVAQKTKAEMIAAINQTFAATQTLISQFNLAQLKDTLEYFGLHRTKRQILLLLADHITHHRAQMLVSMRLKGLVPPRYVLYQ